MWTASDHIFQLGIMLTVILGAQALARRATRKRLRAEARRVRIALAVGLEALRKVHEDNLGLLTADGQPLLSGRNQIHLLRAQLGRLAILEDVEVEAVMTACVAAERAETEIAVTSRKTGAVGITLLPDNPAARQRLAPMLQETCSSLLAAEQLLRPGAPPGDAALAPTPGSEVVAKDSRARADT